MMEKDDFIKDDFLRDLIRQSPPDCPSNDFTDRVMANIELSQEVAVSGKPFFMYVKSAIPYMLVTMLLLVVFATSDLPFFSWLPGKDFLIDSLYSYFATFFTVLKTAFASKYVSWVVLISFSAAVLYTIDRLFSRRTTF